MSKLLFPIVLDYCYAVSGVPKYSLVIGVAMIQCILQPVYTSNQLVNEVYVNVIYALFKKDTCVTFQSFGDDAQICSYTLNYLQPGMFNYHNRRYSTRMKIQYYTYLRHNATDNLHCMQDKNAGVLIKTTAPEISRLQFYNRDNYMECSMT